MNTDALWVVITILGIAVLWLYRECGKADRDFNAVFHHLKQMENRNAELQCELRRLQQKELDDLEREIHGNQEPDADSNFYERN